MATAALLGLLLFPRIPSRASHVRVYVEWTPSLQSLHAHTAAPGAHGSQSVLGIKAEENRLCNGGGLNYSLPPSVFTPAAAAVDPQP